MTGLTWIFRILYSSPFFKANFLLTLGPNWMIDFYFTTPVMYIIHYTKYMIFPTILMVRRFVYFWTYLWKVDDYVPVCIEFYMGLEMPHLDTLEEWMSNLHMQPSIIRSTINLLEPVCCKKQQKKVPDQLLVCRIGDLWMTWMIPNWLYESLIIQD